MKNCVIVSAARTAIGSFNGALATTGPSSLEQPSLEPLFERAHLDPQRVDEVIMGNVLQSGARPKPGAPGIIKKRLIRHRLRLYRQQSVRLRPEKRGACRPGNQSGTSPDDRLGDGKHEPAPTC